MQIGEKLKRLRLQRALTQEELGDRCDLTKGFISQLERDMCSPSIETLADLLEALGTNLSAFFSERDGGKLVFSEEDTFVREDDDTLRGAIRWLVPDAQKNDMEPILIELAPGGATETDDPHEGEEFGYVLSGNALVEVGERSAKARRGESFYYRANAPHRLVCLGKSPARLIWVSTPPSF